MGQSPADRWTGAGSVCAQGEEHSVVQGQHTRSPLSPAHTASSQEASWGICQNGLHSPSLFMLLGPDLPKQQRAGARKHCFVLCADSCKAAPSKVHLVLTQHLRAGEKALTAGRDRQCWPHWHLLGWMLDGLCDLEAKHHLSMAGGCLIAPCSSLASKLLCSLLSVSPRVIIPDQISDTSKAL